MSSGMRKAIITLENCAEESRLHAAHFLEIGDGEAHRVWADTALEFQVRANNLRAKCKAEDDAAFKARYAGQVRPATS